MKKKIVSLLLVGYLVMMTGCGAAAPEATAAPATNETATAEVEEEPATEDVEEPADEASDEAEEDFEEEMEIQFDVDDAMAQVIKYYTIEDKAEGEYEIFDNENVDNGDTIEFTVRYAPSDAEEDEMIENGTGPMANILYTTVTVDKATCDAVDADGRKFSLYGEGSVSQMEEPSGDFSFADVAGESFVFSSGVGAWQTILTISEDGSFEGRYEDSNMGETGEGYDNGTVYYCDFDGKFTEPKKVDENSYEFEIENMDTHEPESLEEIKDGIKYAYSAPYGMEETGRMVMYLPGTPLDTIPEDIVSWLFILGTEETALPFHALCNMDMNYGFVGEE